MRLKLDHPAAIEGRSIHRKRVFDPKDYTGNVLKPVSSNKKLGNGSSFIVKGEWRGMPMFSLTLEERATCPRTCHHWQDCYGNNTAFAHRFQAGPDLELRLRAEIAQLAFCYPRGFVVRLHVLGDFYSPEYVQLWATLLQTYPSLRIFGYTARQGDFIAADIALMNLTFRDRCWIRTSMREPNGRQLIATEIPGPDSITCPQQTGKTASCLTCGLCWAAPKPIHFVNH